MKGLSRGLLLIRGVPVKIVSHEENVGSRRDEGMARFHNLKAQETERSHQFSWKNKAGTTDVRCSIGQNIVTLCYPSCLDVVNEKRCAGGKQGC